MSPSFAMTMREMIIGCALDGVGRISDVQIKGRCVYPGLGQLKK
jgi:hypothetical protein